MALFQGSQQTYYESDYYGNYQFTSLNDIINNFLVSYVGENKIIPKIQRADVAFHAQRALQELSFDTFKSIKSQEIVLPPSLTMILPHDYVNYVKISFSDDSGIKRILYPTSKTSNPFAIRQNDDLSYSFFSGANLILNGDFDSNLTDTWSVSPASNSSAWNSISQNTAGTKYYYERIFDKVELFNEELVFSHLWSQGSTGVTFSKAYGCFQRVDVSEYETLDLTATGEVSDQLLNSSSTILAEPGILRIGITSLNPNTDFTFVGVDGVTRTVTPTNVNPLHPKVQSPNIRTDIFDLGFLEWATDPTDATKGEVGEKVLEDIDVSQHSEVWVYITSQAKWEDAAVTATTQGSNGGTVQILPTTSLTDANHTFRENKIDKINLSTSAPARTLLKVNQDGNSRTWNKYKSHTESEHTINDYQDYENNVYWPNEGERYGLDGQYAQVNGSYYIDNPKGLIYFSSVLSGQTIILDYISDGLGTNAEMQVHKFAEEAMYKSIAYAILSTSTYGLAVAPLYKKEKRAAIRQAKLRLSNIKLEEITQIFRGKSKHIKH